MKRAIVSFRFLMFVAFALVAAVWPVAAQAAGGLGTAAGFAVLADGTGLTCTNSNVIGQAGTSSSATAVTSTGCSMSVSPAPGAFADFLTVYNGIAGSLGPCDMTFGAADTLAGVSLASGVYCFPAAAALTGTLTLTGSGPWTFEIGTGGTGALTTTGFNVVGGNPCNAFWWVRQDATSTTSTLQGTVMAGDITLTDTTVAGRAFATGALTMTRSNVVGCGATSPSPGNCAAARAAVANAQANDKVEDAAERAAAKTSPDKTAEQAEDKAENAATQTLNAAVRSACAKPVTPECLAARQALAANVAQDRVEDRAEKASGNDKKSSEKDGKGSDKDNKEKENKKDSAGKSEDKTEQATTRALQQAVNAACGPDRHDGNEDDD